MFTKSKLFFALKSGSEAVLRRFLWVCVCNLSNQSKLIGNKGVIREKEEKRAKNAVFVSLYYEVKQNRH
jgi:hypothetical protein